MEFIIHNSKLIIELVRLRLGDEDSGAGSATGDEPISASMAYPMTRAGIVRQLQDLDTGGAGDIEDDHPGPASMPVLVA